ncbi:2325_t:CDS:2, partial [Scutellospora calospora]
MKLLKIICRIRAYITKYSTTEEIIKEAFVIILGITVSTKQLFCRYSTKKIPSLTNCDLCNTILKDEYQAEVFICRYGYHTICYNFIERKCKYCYEYYETGIKYNVKSFINRLEKGANILTNKDIDRDNNNKDNNNSTDEIEDLNLILNKKDKIEQEFIDKLVKVLD